MSISLSLIYTPLFALLKYCVEALAVVDSMPYAPHARSFPRFVKLDTAPLSPPPPPARKTAPPAPPPLTLLSPPVPPEWQPLPPAWAVYMINSPPDPNVSRYNSAVIVGLPIFTVVIIFVCSFIWSHHQRVLSDQERAGRDSWTPGDTAAQQVALQMQGRQGMDQVLVDKLPTLQFKGQKSRPPKRGRKEYMYSCAVCISDFEEGEMLRLLPACGHAFHKECIDMWLFSHRTCPLCRLGLLNNKGDLILLAMDEEDDQSDSRRGAHVAVDVMDSTSPSLDRQVVSPLVKFFRRTQSLIDLSHAESAGTRGLHVADVGGLRRSCSQPLEVGA